MIPLPVAGFFSRFAWRIGAGAALAALLIVSGFLIAAQVENHRLTRINAELDARISDPRTGYVVRLAQSETNVATTRSALQKQIRDLREQADRNARRLAESERQLIVAQRETAQARREAERLLRRPPDGVTLEDRINDVDARVLEGLQ